MSRCILHAGMYKTGTTSIQHNLRGFADDRFVYADFGKNANHGRAIFGLLGFGTKGIPAPSAGRQREALARFRRCLAAARGRTLVLSGEDLVLLPRDRLKRLRDILRETCDEITVAAAVREPAGLLASTFQERLKRLPRPRIRLLKYRGYRRDFEKFDEVFGRENVTLWKFDPVTYPGGCAVRDFCARLGIALPENRIARFNESLSREALGLLYIYRRAGGELGSMTMTGAQNLRLEAALRPIGRLPMRFHPDAVRPVLEENRDDIGWMERRLDRPLLEPAGPDRPGDVRDESDLLTIDPRAVAELLERLGARAPRGNRGESLQDVARLVHALRLANAGPLERVPLLGALVRKTLGYARTAFARQARFH
jgi:hypothetical protein